MPRSIPRVKRIALSFPLGLFPWQEIARGVYRYAQNQKSWVISIHSEADVSNTLAVKPDGVIAMIHTIDAACKLQAWDGPVVDIAGELDDTSLTRIGFDPLATGKLAAEHLLRFHGRSFACLGNFASPAHRMAYRGFVERLKEAGIETILAPPEDQGVAWAPCDGDLQAWLTEVHNPIAVFCLHDWLAHRLARDCLLSGLAVPRDVAILGCMNDEFLCTLAQPPLSSVNMPVAALGHDAAKLLDGLMAGEPLPRQHELPPLGIVTRQSTDAAALAEPSLAAALRFIRENATSRIGVEDIAAASGLSRSSLERRFRAVVGRSPLAELLRERVERAQHLLLTSALTMKGVASEAGFRDVRHLSVIFRQKTGVSPGRYRARFRPG